MQKSVLHAATAIDEQRAEHARVVADMREEMQRKEQRIMSQVSYVLRTSRPRHTYPNPHPLSLPPSLLLAGTPICLC